MFRYVTIKIYENHIYEAVIVSPWSLKSFGPNQQLGGFSYIEASLTFGPINSFNVYIGSDSKKYSIVPTRPHMAR